jgi:hypothetical protein
VDAERARPALDEHRAEVVPGRIVLHGSAGELPVGYVDPQLGHQAVDPLDVVLARLVPDAARPRMDHHAHLAHADPHRGGRDVVTDLVDHLHLEEVIACSKAP